MRRSGYLLAKVKVRIRRGRLVVEVDEGQLDKVIFKGAGTYKTLRMKLDISIPGNVFNRPHLQRQLKRLGRKYGIAPVTYRLERVEQKQNCPRFIADLAGNLIPPPGRYRLVIELGRRGWGTGLDFDLDYDFPDGMALGAGYRDTGMLARADRWMVSGKAGMKFRNHLDSGDLFLSLSRLRGQFRYFTPAFWRLRPTLWLIGEMTTTQRQDLMIDLYYRGVLDASVSLSLEFMRRMSLSVGGGVSERFIFGIDQLDGATLAVGSSHSFRPFVHGLIEMVFDPDQMRRDTRHALQAQARYFWPREREPYGVARFSYQNVFAFGWHDLVLKLKGAWLWGEYDFDDEEPVGGRYLRGIFGDKWFVGQVGAASLEFRYSLARDLFKLGFFHDLACFNEKLRTEGGTAVRVANSFGVGLHVLVLDWLQLNLYYAVGFAFHGGFDHGVSASLVKAF
ncbi:MAG: hypothetical protein D6806_13190 [Deltaproteobacteria bacterium]|nr:MAG: hypothetical protein D6806_13190 [Deltaproteobacteria bacterium]